MFVPAVEARRIGAEKPFHPGRQIGLRRFHHQMKMIERQTIGVDLPVGFRTTLRQCLEETCAVVIIGKDRLAPIAPARRASIGGASRSIVPGGAGAGVRARRCRRACCAGWPR
jgi:hypothetical protein